MLETTEQQNSAEGIYLWTQSFKYRVSFKDKEEPLRGVRAKARSCGVRRRSCPPACPSVFPPDRHHAGAHLPPAGLVPLALLEGGDGADARGAAVLGQDHFRQCHRVRSVQ